MASHPIHPCPCQKKPPLEDFETSTQILAFRKTWRCNFISVLIYCKATFWKLYNNWSTLMQEVEGHIALPPALLITTQATVNKNKFQMLEILFSLHFRRRRPSKGILRWKPQGKASNVIQWCHLEHIKVAEEAKVDFKERNTHQQV